MSVDPLNRENRRLRKKVVQENLTTANKEKNLSIKKISVILKKSEDERTPEEINFLFKYAEITKEAASRLEKREILKQREKEFEDSEVTLDEKCMQLAEVLSKAKCLVVYTGAGISTAARIPDYRGTSGIWTLLQQGKDIGEHDLTQAEPTYTHMALAEMYRQGKLQHVVSQNCDGLHLRSGLPRKALSELHGNMFIEVCRSCKPYLEYLRQFDVTESTARFAHKTYRRCYKCNNPLTDSIVHFGERGNLPWPLNWKGACHASEESDVILCMGSSLKVLKRYTWLWCMDKPAKRRPKLFIVNLQWTPKDCQAVLKIHGRCDDVMKRVTKFLGIQVPEYSRTKDPIFHHSTPLCNEEQHTTTRQPLPPAPPEDLIVITVASDPKICCDNLKNKEITHDTTCPNFVEAAKDIPVIMAADMTSSTSQPAPQQYSLVETMFYNYLYTFISSISPYGSPAPFLPLPSTSKMNDLPAKSDDETDPPKKPKLEETTLPMCSFCKREYGSYVCLFYERHESFFKEDVSPCLCCEDDEEGSGSENKDGEKVEAGSEDKECCSAEKPEGSGSDLKDEEACCDTGDKNNSEPSKSCNPGWYGKGWKVKKRKR